MGTRRTIGRRRYAVLAAALAAAGAIALVMGMVAQRPGPPVLPAESRSSTGSPASSSGRGTATPGGPGIADGHAHRNGHANGHANGRGHTEQPAHREERPRPDPPTRADAPARPEGLVGPILPASVPTRIRIPALGLSGHLERLGTDAAGQMEVPREPGHAGWFSGAPTPGSAGPAVIAGHVTWNREPAVFFDLADLRPGDRVAVDRSDGRTAVFTVTRLGEYGKARFPTAQVYGPIDHAGLRLITCGGEYDDRRHRYSANVVVFAALSTTRPRHESAGIATPTTRQDRRT